MERAYQFLKDTLNEAYIKQEYSLGNICEFDWGEVKEKSDGSIFSLRVGSGSFGTFSRNMVRRVLEESPTPLKCWTS